MSLTIQGEGVWSSVTRHIKGIGKSWAIKNFWKINGRHSWMPSIGWLLWKNYERPV